MTNDQDFADCCQLRCNHSHRHWPDGMVGMGQEAVAQTAYYPDTMVKQLSSVGKPSTLEAFDPGPRTFRWRCKPWRSHNFFFVNVHKQMPVDEQVTVDEKQTTVKGKEKSQKDHALALLHRLHQAAGHPSNRALARLCRNRGMPPLVVQMAQGLKCQACEDTKTGGQMTVPISVGERP